MKKLNQILAIEKGVKGRYQSDVSDLYKTVQKPALFSGLNKTYIKKNEDDDDLPPENVRVQFTVPSLLKDLQKRAEDLFDVEATKDYANCNARANVVLDGKTLVENAPATYLLFLEKQLTDLRTFLSKVPTLDPSEEWAHDDNAGVYKTHVVKTSRTKKVQKPIVLYDATDKHPAQTQLITEDVQVGTWNTVKHSGAVSEKRRDEMVDRTERLLKAVKEAREEANSVNAESVSVGRDIFDYIFN